MAKHKYTGILARPVAMPDAAGDFHAFMRWLTDRMNALIADCGANELRVEDQLRMVALVLATRHVPAFRALRPKPRVGPPRKTSGAEDAKVLAEMNRLIASGMSQRSAAANLSTKLRKTGPAITTQHRRLQKILKSLKS